MDVFTIVCLIIVGLCLVVSAFSCVFGLVKAIILKVKQRKLKKELDHTDEFESCNENKDD